jgi:hypothetical protein
MVGVVGSNIKHSKNFSQVVPVKARFIDEAEELLNKQLKPYGRKVYKVSGDGNCQFRALSHQLKKSVKYHMEVRQNVCIQLANDPDLYLGKSVHHYLSQTLGHES